ncbi:glycoside hydrolase family 3 protein [Daldinia vernicosa]|uniref:glycoside hydrolase family 3 protein n=1 Tax=Daldinia vernicosa TaxID=114800 RepID=UPI002008C97D|nr:glycoside hydrolase family 3 protein [Daldinia vernicosa]KAI0847383.1 glycoside hydrolase family 3 protein [Daldinia vernicosa]
MGSRLLVLLALSAWPLNGFCFSTPRGPRQSLQGYAASNDSGTPAYRDSSLCVNDRVEDLFQRMTLEEKAGQMFHAMLFMGPNGTLDEGSEAALRNSTDFMIGNQFLTHFNLVGDITDARETAEFHNRVQQRARETRLGIPITLSSDPRHHFTENIGTGFNAGRFSQWPETLGLAALRDADLVRRFAEIAREEYLAVGLRAALHPQVDLTTEPRWARIAGTFGEDSNLTAELLTAYIKGFQGEKFGLTSVSTVTKHFPGGGPMENGEDSHFVYGKNETYPGNNFDHHLIPFRAAIAADARQMMPYYSRPIGTQYEPVGFSFNKGIVTDLLRNELGFEGVVVTDWGLITDTYLAGQYMPARAWGVEDLSELERAARILEAGCDQFGGETRPELIVQLVHEGVVSEERLDVSVRKLLREKFMLGLFDNPFVDTDAAARIVGNDYFTRLGNEAQRRSYTLLTNKDETLPLRNAGPETKFYIEGFNATLLQNRGYTVVDKLEDADYALLRLAAPYQPRPGGVESMFHAGSLEFSAEERARQEAIYSTVPAIVDMMLDRPAAVPEVAERSVAMLASFGSSSEAFLDIIFGVAEPEGKLPYDLPRSNAAVEAAMEDVPFDTKDPVFRFGHGLSYADRHAYDNGVQCSLPRYHSCYCNKHHLEERSLYHFYKFVEREWEWYQHKELEHNDINKLTWAHYLLSIAICARRVHTSRYFREDRCEGHEQRVLWLLSDRNEIEESILLADYGIIGQQEATKGIRRVLLEAVENIDEELGKTEFQRLLTEFPAIQIVPEDTPGARTKATDDAEKEARKKYYSLGDW